MSIEFKDVRKAFSEKAVLDGVSFTVKSREILFILGKSGVGKSVTLKHVVGLLKPDAGEVHVDGVRVSSSDETVLAAVRRVCGMVFQHPALLDSLTVFENVAFGLRGTDIGPARIHERVIECLRLVHLDASILERKPIEISYGMQKRVSIARTLAPSPRYLLFDEPTTGLDPITTNAVNDLIHELSRSLGVTSVVVSHDMGSALRIADRILVLDEGTILALGDRREIRESHVPLIREFLSEVD
ncbi:MAG: ATP-binding cassette domain-containing protein [Deltaproteobacteria bacterium]|nr:ATP-binding cassette domain-containing protein [Deltaproteobacteria bacterium]